MTDSFHVEIHSSVATITLANPPANTWTLESLQQLDDQLEQLHSLGKVTCLIIRSESSEFFSAGLDLKALSECDRDTVSAWVSAAGRIFEKLTDFPGVTIAAINGMALGFGFELALACDLRVAGDTAVFGLPEASVGLLPCAGGTQTLTLLVGEGWAKRVLLCGERLHAGQALQIGLTEEIVGPAEVHQRAAQLASEVSVQSPDSIVSCKQLIQMGRRLPRYQALMAERELFLAQFGSNNQQEGLSAFLEKRQPVWCYKD